jgi:hypothetical protein
VVEFVDNCHLFNTVKIAVEDRKLSAVVFPWIYLELNKKSHQYTEACRREHGIYNGMSFGTRFSNFIEAFSVGGHKDEEDFFKKLSNVQPYLQSFKLKLREIVLSEMIARGWESTDILKHAMTPHQNLTVIGNYQPKRSYFI